MSVYGWLTILSRVDLNFPTGLTLSDYTSGFGNISTNFWLGLQRTYLLTNSAVNGGKTYRLRIELLASENNRLIVASIFCPQMAGLYSNAIALYNASASGILNDYDICARQLPSAVTFTGY